MHSRNDTSIDPVLTSFLDNPGVGRGAARFSSSWRERHSDLMALFGLDAACGVQRTLGPGLLPSLIMADNR